MENNLEKIIQETRELSLENNKILRKMERRTKWAIVFTIVYWLFIISATIGAFYFIQPYINAISSEFSTATGGDVANQAKSSSGGLNDMINLIKGSLNSGS
ncbi:MAG: hypothetical protein WCW87_04025 [Candidatus Paceibacterota bacterium]